MHLVTDYIEKNIEVFIEELTDFLRIPSISAHSDHHSDCENAASWLKNQFLQIGFEVKVYSTPGKPIVFAQYHAGDDLPTILVYGHYDVQPVDPLELWVSPPFEPRREEDNLFARGATDDKGQIFAHIKAVESLIKTKGKLPVNVKFLIEGEEEISSPHIEDFLFNHKDELYCDVVIVSDTGQFAPGYPAISYGLRGVCAEEIRVEGANQDLHSGIFGGAVPNPCEEVSHIIAKLKDSRGRVLIPGFYDDVVPLEEWERTAFAALPFDVEQFKKELDLKGVHGEEGYSVLEQRSGRPTMEVNGIFGGYAGEGSKKVLPAWAGAKISMRLVPNQEPQKIHELFTKYVQQVTPDYIKLSFSGFHGAKPVVVPRNARFMEEAIQAIEKGFGKRPLFMREGGSIHIVMDFKEILGVNTLLIGLGQPDDNAHAPNEKFSMSDFKKGIKTSAWFLELSRMNAL